MWANKIVANLKDIQQLFMDICLQALKTLFPEKRAMRETHAWILIGP